MARSAESRQGSAVIPAVWVSARIPSLSLPRLAKDLSRQMQVQMFAQSVLEGPVALYCHVTVARHRHGLFATRPPSLSELASAIEACLGGIVFRRQTQVVRLSLSKTYGPVAGVKVTVVRIAADEVPHLQDRGGADGTARAVESEASPDGA